MTALLEVTGADVVIQAARILRGADLTAHRGELVAVVGPNGAGKSTLARSAAGIQKLSAGSVRWLGQELKGRKLAKVRAFVPQRPRVPEGITVREAVDIGRSPHIGPLRRATRADHGAVDRALERTEVAGLADRKLTTLSGGELQRVQIAVGLAQEAPALIADEPTAHLDLGATAAVARLLRGLADDGLAVLLVVHDLALAAAVADRAVVLSKGAVVASGPPEDVLDPDRLAEVWSVDASLETSGGRTALHVAWLNTNLHEELNR